MRYRLTGYFLLIPAALLLASCGGNGSGGGGGGGGTDYSSSPTSPSGGSQANVLITIKGVNGGMSFSPASATVTVGQTVAWRNADSITHRPFPDSQSGFDPGNVSGGATSKAIQMNTAGVFPYHCTIHPSMTGTITVTQ